VHVIVRRHNSVTAEYFTSVTSSYHSQGCHFQWQEIWLAFTSSVIKLV